MTTAILPTNTTPKDEITVFTYELDVNKVDENDQPLSGSRFTLWGLVKDDETTSETMYSWEEKGIGIPQAVKDQEDNVIRYTADFWVDDGVYMLAAVLQP